jgi:hypothetical protein
MFAVELTFESNARGTRDAKTEAITWLTAALVRNGNLLKEFILVSESNGWTVYGVAPARDAFPKGNWNEFVQQRRAIVSGT